jgi:HD-GYP domain-containing protein (c-di-GMP phosphodiesterase class II)
MRLGRRNPAADGATGAEAVVLALAAPGDARARQDALLAAVTAHVGVPAAYLYLADDGGRRFYLDRSFASANARPAGVDLEDMPEGGAADDAPTPPLELVRGKEWDTERVAATPAGRLLSVPLRLDGATVGLLQVGPLTTANPPAAWSVRLAAVAPTAAAVVVRLHEEARLRAEIASYASRESVGRKLHGSAMQVERHLSLLLSMAVTTTGVDGGFVGIVDERTREVEVMAQQGLPDGFVELADLSPPTGLFDWSAAAGGALFLHDFEAATRLGIGSVLAVPLLEGGEALGIFALLSFGRRAPIGVEALDLLATYSEQAQQALRNDRLFRSFAESYLDTVRGLARSLDARRPHTQGHHPLVGRIAHAIASGLGRPAGELDAIRFAGEIHDVGLAGAATGTDGYQADYDHPTVGAGLIEHLPLHPAVAEAVVSHHEWFDGWGFPHGLRGDAIPLPGRILGAAELVAELASGDPVRAPWPAERILAEVQQRRGSQLDPTVADVTIHLLSGGHLLDGAPPAHRPVE